MTIKDRVYSFIQKTGINARQFEQTVGLSNGAVSKMGNSTRRSVLDKIISAYPQINQVWLLTGEGEMLKAEASETLTKYQYHEDDVPEQFTAYLVPMAAMGGSLVGFEDEGVRRENCERVISPVANADWVVPVCGDSMEPEYPNGSRVYVQQIYPDDFIAWGNVFVLDTTNGIIIKVVKESEKENCVRCESLNPSGRYAPFDVPLRSIRAMYRVLLCVSVK